MKPRHQIHQSIIALRAPFRTGFQEACSFQRIRKLKFTRIRKPAYLRPAERSDEDVQTFDAANSQEFLRRIQAEYPAKHRNVYSCYFGERKVEKSPRKRELWLEDPFKHFRLPPPCFEEASSYTSHRPTYAQTSAMKTLLC